MDDNTELILNRLSDLAAVVSGGRDVEYMNAQLESASNLGDVEKIFRTNQIPWGNLVEKDAREILDGRPPIYFMLHEQRAQLYLQRRAIVPSRHSEGRDGVSVRDAAAELMATLKRWWREQEEYGVVPELYESYPCYEEQRYFYATEEWINTARATRFLAEHRCENCGTTDTKLHVHHLGPLVSAYDRAFDRNFDFCRLRALCPDCHARFHSRNVRGDA